MPPISGWGMGIDRFVALLTEAPNLRDVVWFPLMKPLATKKRKGSRRMSRKVAESQSATEALGTAASTLFETLRL